MSRSYVHQKWLDIEKEMYEGQPREMQRLSDTHWACRYLACKTVKDRLPASIHVLEKISQKNNWERVESPNWFEVCWTACNLHSSFRRCKTLVQCFTVPPNWNLALQLPLLNLLWILLKTTERGHTLRRTGTISLILPNSATCYSKTWRESQLQTRWTFYYLSNNRKTDRNGQRHLSYIHIHTRPWCSALWIEEETFKRKLQSDWNTGFKSFQSNILW